MNVPSIPTETPGDSIDMSAAINERDEVIAETQDERAEVAKGVMGNLFENVVGKGNMMSDVVHSVLKGLIGDNFFGEWIAKFLGIDIKDLDEKYMAGYIFKDFEKVAGISQLEKGKIDNLKSEFLSNSLYQNTLYRYIETRKNDVQFRHWKSGYNPAAGQQSRLASAVGGMGNMVGGVGGMMTTSMLGLNNKLDNLHTDIDYSKVWSFILVDIAKNNNNKLPSDLSMEYIFNNHTGLSEIMKALKPAETSDEDVEGESTATDILSDFAFQGGIYKFVTITEKTQLQKKNGDNFENVELSSSSELPTDIKGFIIKEDKIYINSGDEGKLQVFEIKASVNSVKSLDTIDLDYNTKEQGTITKISGLSDFLNLENLKLKNFSDLTVLDISGCTKLTEVKIEGCTNLTEVKIEGCNKLTEIKCERMDLVIEGWEYKEENSFKGYKKGN